VSEKCVLTGIFGLKGGGSNKRLKEIAFEELPDLYSSLYVTGMMKSMRMRW
jgi:hypothetical protein